jgi:hypothetical protein
MRATTIKVEGVLLEELERSKPRSQSLSAYVRSILESEVRRLKMLAAAEKYSAFLQHNADERAWLDEWDSADLARPPRRRRR